MELVNNWPETRDLIGIFSAIKKENAGRTWPVHKGEVARDMEALERLGWVRIEPVGAEHVAYYQLTTAGRDRLLADRERALKRGKN
jgi:DNA-binding PadR family transcriptional regulator